MWEWVAQLSPAMQALLGTMFTWGMTALGAAIVFMTKSINARLMDSMLGFAGGAMIFVVVEEVIPGSQENGHKDMASMALMLGFTIMMILDVALG
ncbi:MULTISPECIES: hypothetical protein [unclassified Exiguobacterium]|uniref:hypothetical protein n=1 Tax=unclassified Exiguobacterium TaxID=2644629 RepID=UPI001BEA2167|nr:MULTISPECIES: hypothetical protein [unclassified Exiguobacterium]